MYRSWNSLHEYKVLTHSPTRLLTHSPTHSLTHSSIEDRNDILKGASIDYQQKKVASIFTECGSIRSNILTECGQNPGLIQHYVFHALNQMNHLTNPSQPADYRRGFTHLLTY